MSEHEYALMEANRIHCCDEYFADRPQCDFVANRRIYEAGHDAGWKAQQQRIAELEAIIAESKENKKWPVMGEGNFAVGGCVSSADKALCGIIYLPLSEQLPVGTDTSHIYPIGTVCHEPSACVYFATAEAIEQTIEVLRDQQKLHFPLFAAPVMKEKI